MALTSYKQYLAYYLADYFKDKKKLGFWFRLVSKYDSEDILFIFSLTKDIIRHSKKPINNPAGLYIKLFFDYIKRNQPKIKSAVEIKQALDNVENAWHND